MILHVNWLIDWLTAWAIDELTDLSKQDGGAAASAEAGRQHVFKTRKEAQRPLSSWNT